MCSKLKIVAWGIILLNYSFYYSHLEKIKNINRLSGHADSCCQGGTDIGFHFRGTVLLHHFGQTSKANGSTRPALDSNRRRLLEGTCTQCMNISDSNSCQSHTHMHNFPKNFRLLNHVCMVQSKRHLSCTLYYGFIAGSDIYVVLSAW